MTRASPRDPRAGFTLIEILVALAIAGLVLAAVPLALSGTLARHRLTGAAERVAASLREAHIRAMTTGRTASFLADVEQRRFALAGDHTWLGLPRNVRLEVTSGAEDIMDPGIARIRFFPDGGSTGGGVVLSAPEGSYSVVVDWFTGRVSVVDLHRVRPGS